MAATPEPAGSAHVTPLIAGSTGLFAKRTAVVVLVVLAILAGLEFLWLIRQILLWLVIGGILAMALEPAVDWLVRHRLKRGMAVTIVMVVAIIVVIAVAALLAVPLVQQATKFVKEFPSYVDKLTAPGSRFAWVDAKFHVQEKIRALSPKAVDIALGARTPVFSAVGKTFAFIAATVSVLTFVILLMLEGPRVWRWVLSMIREDLRDDAAEFGHRLLYSIGGYVRGNGLISLIAGVGAWIALKVLGVPYALTLAVVVGLLDLIPLIGATLGAIICVLVAATQGWVPAAVVAGYFLVYQQIENNVIQPAVYSRTVALSPLAVLFATLSGAAIGGIVGVLLAIPAAASVYITIAELQKLRREARGEPDAGGGGGGAGGQTPDAKPKRRRLLGRGRKESGAAPDTDAGGAPQEA